jgi:hypothetical protein
MRVNFSCPVPWYYNEFSGNQTRPSIHFGVLQNKVGVADDFDAPLPESLLAAFARR